MKNKKFIVITSINHPTIAVEEFSKWSGWTTIVVGDRKSPTNGNWENIKYLSLEDQKDLFPEFCSFLPENTYIRKMVGYLYAFKNGAEAIFESDDDNIPYANACEQVELDLTSSRERGQIISSGSGWANIYKEFGALDCWPRGYPLQYIQESTEEERPLNSIAFPWGVMQYLADEDPDVDAIYRMTHSSPVYFARDRLFRLKENTFCPFNSQATLWLPEAFPLMFLPIGKSDRVTDILRGYMSLACLWKSGRTLAYSSPVVYQKRNFHNLFKDFEQELDLYKHGDEWSKLLMKLPYQKPNDAFISALDLMVEKGFLPKLNLEAFRHFVSWIK
ncbi:hypothetical protein [Polynucleobacter nymphae]|uniref:hypothetical protein n=1 Tax=Polynucleobacter nymphae TaxID=2081043 RepID=UPI001C0E12BA|nr:hypothetical protein [Polynucleobacter nymphae]MBU3607780.1 hypothetical protein [Polynucleobacter nymphae]